MAQAPATRGIGGGHHLVFSRRSAIIEQSPRALSRLILVNRAQLAMLPIISVLLGPLFLRQTALTAIGAPPRKPLRDRLYVLNLTGTDKAIEVFRGEVSELGTAATN